MLSETEINLILIGCLLLSSALVSCLETSITAASRAKIHRMASDGDKRASKIEKLLKNREKVVSVMLLANNAVNIAASAITTKILLGIFGEIGLIYATFSLTIFIIIFGEILPKTYAIKSPENTVLFFAGTIIFLFRIFTPFTRIIQELVDLVMKILGSKNQKKTQEAELEEIRDTVDLKAKEGSIFKYDKDLIDGVLDLSDTEISEIMVHRKDVDAIDISLPIGEILNYATGSNYTRIPLWRNKKDNIVAILNVRKFLKGLHFHQGNIEEFDLASATSEPWFVPANNSLRSQLFAFRKKKKRFALVVDEYGSWLGLVTLEDILEEIVGEIKEQDDAGEINIVKTKTGAYKIAGKTLIRDINRKLDWNLEGEDAYSLNAFVIAKLGRIPQEKEKFILENYSFDVLKKRNHELLLLKVKGV